MWENLLREWFEFSTKFPVVGIFPALLPFILPAFGALRGGAGRSSEQSTSEAIDFTETGSRSGSQQPVISEDVLPLRGDIIEGFRNLLSSPTGISEEGLNQAELAEIQRINAGFNPRDISSRLASQGLLFSPTAVGSLAGTVEGQRGRALADSSRQFALERFMLPRIEEQIRQSRLGGAGNFLQSIPFGTETESDFSGRRTGTTDRRTTGNVGGGVRGAIGGAAEAGTFGAFAGLFDGDNQDLEPINQTISPPTFELPQGDDF